MITTLNELQLRAARIAWSKVQRIIRTEFQPKSDQADTQMMLATLELSALLHSGVISEPIRLQMQPKTNELRH